jgi:hypothetical protein
MCHASAPEPRFSVLGWSHKLGMSTIVRNELEAGLESVSRAEFEESTKLECARRMPQLA